MAAQAAPAGAPTQPNLTSVKADFVPGEKTLFYDDFTDIAGDEPPPHWKVRGGSVELRVGGDIRQSEVIKDRITMTPNIKGGLPPNFTFETEVMFDETADVRSVWFIHDQTWDGPNGPEAALRVYLQRQNDELYAEVNHAGKDVAEQLGHTSLPVDFSQPFKEAIRIQNGRLRVYV